MKEITVVEQLCGIVTGKVVSSVLLKEQYLYLGTGDGAIVVYEITEHAGEFELKKHREIPNFTPGAIETMLQLEDSLITLSNGEVAIYDFTTLQLQETLPFRQITHLTSWQNQLNSYMAISTKTMIVVYIWTNGQFEEIKQYKTTDKIVLFEFISENSIIAASNPQFYLYDSNSTNEPTKIPFHSQFSFFNQKTTIIPNNETVLLTKGSHSIKWNNETKTTIGSMHWDSNSHELKFISPFLLSFTGNHVKFMDFENLQVYQNLIIPKVCQQFASQNDKLVFITKDSVQLYKILPLEKIIDQLETTDLQKSIEFVNQLTKQQYESKSLKLRSLEIANAIELFDNKNYGTAIRKFSDYVAPPMTLIKLYPSYISGLRKDEHEQSKEDDDTEEDHKIDEKAISLLVNYLTDIRRKFNKVIGADGHELDYLDSKLTISSFTEEKYSIDEIRSAVDSTLFRCYNEMNSGLIGSLVRVDNYCDPDLVITTFKSKNMISELIDFYNKKGYHEQALDLLGELFKDPPNPDPVVKYIQNLKNDHLDLILKYSDWPISIMESYGIEIFLNSQYADSFNRAKVVRYLHFKSQNLERIYLEYIIIELKDKAKTFNTRLVEIYFDELEKEKNNPESIYFKKLYTFLQSGNYDASNALEYLPDDETHLRLLKTFILKRLGKHEDALELLLKDINDSSLAIHYVQDLFKKDVETGKSFFLKLISMFWVNKDKVSIMKLLSTSKDSNIPLIDILNTLPPEFKIFEIEQVLIKSLRLQRKIHSLASLSRNLKSVENVKTEENLLNAQNSKIEVIANETRCPVCGSYLANSVLSRFPNGDVVHFGCTKAYHTELDSNIKSQKLKTMKLKDYKLS